MNRKAMTEELARRTSLTAGQARRVLLALFGTAPGVGLIADTLDRGERIVISGFGTFAVKARPRRDYRDPRSGETRSAPPGRVALFRPGVALKERLS